MKPRFGGVLCAGFGTRMAPITDVLPKPLIPFLNVPLLTYALNHLARGGARDVACNLHHLADAIPPVADRLALQFGLTISYAREWEILGTAGGIWGIWSALGSPAEGTLAIFNGDSVMNCDLAAQFEAHELSGAKVSLMVRPRAKDQPGRVWLDGAGRLVGLRDHRVPGAGSSLGEHDFLGVHLIDLSLLSQLEGTAGDIIALLYGPMLEQGALIRPALHEGFWAAIDTPRLLLDTTKACLMDPGLFDQAPLPSPLAPGLYVYDQQAVDDHAVLGAPVLLGAGAQVSRGVRLGPNVSVDGTSLAQGTQAEDAILYGMGHLEGQWQGCVAVAGKVAHAGD